MITKCLFISARLWESVDWSSTFLIPTHLYNPKKICLRMNAECLSMENAAKIRQDGANEDEAIKLGSDANWVYNDGESRNGEKQHIWANTLETSSRYDGSSICGWCPVPHLIKGRRTAERLLLIRHEITVTSVYHYFSPLVDIWSRIFAYLNNKILFLPCFSVFWDHILWFIGSDDPMLYTLNIEMTDDQIVES